MIVGHEGQGNLPRWHLASVCVTDKTAATAPVMFLCGAWPNHNRWSPLLNPRFQRPRQDPLSISAFTLTSSSLSTFLLSPQPTGQWFAKDLGDGQIVRTLLPGVSTKDLINRRYKVRRQHEEAWQRGLRVHEGLALSSKSALRKVHSPATAPSLNLIILSSLSTLTFHPPPPTLHLSNPNLPPSQVSVKTSDIRGAGTDANVYMTLFGEGPDGKVLKSTNFKLDNSANNFERGIVSVPWRQWCWWWSGAVFGFDGAPTHAS